MNAHGPSGLRRPGTRLSVAILVFALAALGMITVSPAAKADTAPPSGTPATVSADALPTWQINGVVWSQVTVGNIVYATGSFTTARPPGVALNGPGQINVGNLIAYNITTGNLITSFNHVLNAQGLTITASPDGSRVYVGGDFTTVDGIARSHIAAFDTATGALDTSFAPSINGEVRAIVATNTTVYAGGAFMSAAGVARTRLAAFTASNGTMLPWAPTADNGYVWAMVITPDQSKVVIGGQFSTLSGQSVYGMGAVDATTGAVQPWAANATIQDYNNGAIDTLTTDGNQIYGGGFAYGAGATFEGTFALNPNTGAINWLNDCQGDTYGTLPVGQVLYTVSHAHNCQMIGAFPQSNPWAINQRHALAFTTYPTGTNSGPDEYGWNYAGIPDSSLLQWFPQLYTGTYTGQDQAAWSVTGNSQYIALGGEFPGVNYKSQQGLTRFAISSLAPNKMGPVAATGSTNPVAIPLAGNSIRVSWQLPWDPDNNTLYYKVYRSGTTAPVYTTTQNSNYWTNPTVGFIDTTAPAGGSYTYTVVASDPFGNTLTLPATNSVTPGTASSSKYAGDVSQDGASDFWRMGESAGPTVYDNVGFNDATAQSGVTFGTPGPLSGDPTTAATFNGTSTGAVATNSTVTPTNSLTIEAWFNTTTTSGGKIVGYGSSQTGLSGNYDRQIYMDNAGHLIFGVYNGGTQTIQSANTYNDGNWHYVVATLSATNGMTLYVDGRKVGTNSGATTFQPYTGYWRIGGDQLAGWPNQPSSNYFAGSIGDVAIYPTALSIQQVQTHYTDGGGVLNLQPVPTDAYGKLVYNANPDLYWRLDESSGPTAFDTSPNMDNGVYSSTGVTYAATASQIPGTSNTAVTFDGQSGSIGSTTMAQAPTVYTESLWFKTTTTSGGVLMSYGDQQSGLSSNYDREIWMTPSGQLNFGVWTGSINSATSPLSYNDGKWHQVVATQGPDGMTLYVDGAVVATNAQTQAQSYSGYWRVGGNTAWSGSNYFAGTIDEVAAYSHELSATDVANQFAAGGGSVPAQAPTASFTASTSGLGVSVNGSGSTDPNAGGSIASYDWNWGDGTADGSGSSATHTYAAAGTYTVTLTVTDAAGLTNSTTQSVTVTAPAQAPTASFTASTSGLGVSVNGSGSTDPNAGGSIASYDWNWGDGTADGSGSSATHTYAAAGTYTVTLTVTDAAGLTNSTTQSVTVTAPAQAPTASFTASTSGLGVSVNGSGSTDPNAGGSIASYDWNWGDGTADGSGSSATHTYAAAGTYTVTLTVTDAAGLTNSTTQSVTVAPAPTVIASDAFNRTVASGWGVADSGGTWAVSGTGFSITPGAAVMPLATAGASPSAFLKSVSTINTDEHVTVALNKALTGNGAYIYVIGRWVKNVGDYRAKVQVRANGTVALGISRFDGSTEVAAVPLTVISGLTVQPGQALNIRFDATGTSPTTLQAKVWAAGTTEPSAWQVSATDTTAAMQVPGAVGLGAYLSGSSTSAPVTATFSGFTVYDASTVPLAAQANVRVGGKMIPAKVTRPAPTKSKLQKLTTVTKANARSLGAVSRWWHP
ncbi:PKD domain-containing protein [Rudaeicoccus suwonensis]|uniref:PKD repeat protein n=1 Tax=Rudaeicoccus suwonensis TaxID=657409 RepID=A0A561E892_9MICO|nr:PKD domain-containing protein [Rudaeicoccus suwonensis]TWE11816.1 PKD repeat protein [Rudaeicoccus suwonensis]